MRSSEPTQIKNKVSGWPRNLLYISVFAVIFAGYAFCETEMIHLFWSNSYVIYLLDLLTFALLPVPMLMLLKEYAKKSCWKWINLVLSLAFINFFAQALLNFQYIGPSPDVEGDPPD